MHNLSGILDGRNLGCPNIVKILKKQHDRCFRKLPLTLSEVKGTLPVMDEKTIISLFESSVARWKNNVLMWERSEGGYAGATYGEIHDTVIRCAAGLLSLGVRRGDRIALLSEGRNQWVISELAILYAGAINVPLSVKLQPGGELKFRLQHAGCRMAIVSGPQANKIRDLRHELPDLELVILLDPQPHAGQGELSIEDLHRRGREYLAACRAQLDARIRSVTGADPANICYTSGTTADPKGIVLTHRNYTANVEQASALLPIPESYVSLLILPWDHCFAHTAGIYTLMKNGASMASVQPGKTPVETLRNIPKNIREVRPTFLLSVPTLAKNFRRNVESAIEARGKVARRLFTAGLAVAYAFNADGWDRGKGLRRLLKPAYGLFDLILFRKIRQAFGGRLEFFIGGGALLDIELQRFFYAIGIPMFQGYGLSEAAPIISANVPLRHKLGSSGSIVENLEVRICDDEGSTLPAGCEGEIVVRGENVMSGYWRNEKATREVLKDGWLHTGDLGFIDRDNFLYVLGRTKSLLIAGDGEKFSPEGIEEAICGQSRFIDQLMLHNNQSPYTTALLVPNREAVLAWLHERNLDPVSPEGQGAALTLLRKELDAYRRGGCFEGMFDERWLPAAVGVIPEAFSEQNGFLNSTLKMVRGRITEAFQDKIGALHTAEGKDFYHPDNRAAIAALK